MKKLWILLLLLSSVKFLSAQDLFVDQALGRPGAAGTQRDPLSTLQEAVRKASGFRGDRPVKIIVGPGLYSLNQPLIIGKRGEEATNSFSIQARITPGDKDYLPALMPVIQVSADSNREGKLPHASIALSIERDNVVIKGLKFIGNPNPRSEYYYPIERRNEKLKNLKISQCYFIGEKNAAPIQGAVFAQGEGIHIDHCLFYNCKNAVLSFLNVKDFALTHTLIYGAYEAALWFGFDKYADLPFRFHNNVIAGCHYAVVGYKGLHHNYNFSNSLFTSNKYYLGVNGDQLQPDTINHPIENNVQKSGKVILEEITVDSVPRNYLNLSPASAGSNLQAGIFK